MARHMLFGSVIDRLHPLEVKLTSGTAGTPSADVITVQGVSGGTTIPVTVDATAHPTPYSTVATGEVAGSVTEAVFPTLACKFARIKALTSNAGNVYLGIDNVTKPDGTTDTTTGFELCPGEDTGWLPIDNLNRLYRICDNAGDDVTYMVVV